MSTLSLADAERIAKAALAVARASALPPMTVAVVDAGGHVSYAAREDGSGLAAVDIAAGKARAAITFNCSSREIAVALSGNPQASQSVLAVLSGGIVLLAGAVLIRGADGTSIGAIGAAGSAPDDDEAIVVAAVQG